MNLVVRFLGTVFALLLAAHFIPGFVVESVYAAMIVAVVLGIINITLKPLLLLLTLPLTLLTLGLFTFVVNAFFLWFIANFVEGFSVVGFAPAFLGGLVIAAVLWVLGLFFRK